MLKAVQEIFLRCFFIAGVLACFADLVQKLVYTDLLTQFKIENGMLHLLFTRSESTIRKNWLRVVFKIKAADKGGIVDDHGRIPFEDD
ncbi:hypothetical protein ACTL32_07655 [Planococcus sp. FY231025]|uniref:hypothetical protein n=1 Tax=Planococcus sp. FY231025 TaxID=3455699 RepID=UPI003F91AC79